MFLKFRDLRYFKHPKNSYSHYHCGNNEILVSSAGCWMDLSNNLPLFALNCSRSSYALCIDLSTLPRVALINAKARRWGQNLSLNLMLLKYAVLGRDGSSN